MTATMEESGVKKRSRRSKYEEAKENFDSTMDLLDDLVTSPETAQEANAAYNEKVQEREEELNRGLEWARSLEITSIKLLSGKVYIEFKHGIENFKAKTSAQSVGDVPDTFIDALNGLAPHVAKLLFRSLDEQTWQIPQIEVKGINMKHFEEGNIHVGISFTLTLKNGRQLSATTPQMPMQSDNTDIATHGKEGGAPAIERFISVTQTLLSRVEKTGNLFANLED